MRNNRTTSNAIEDRTTLHRLAGHCACSTLEVEVLLVALGGFLGIEGGTLLLVDSAWRIEIQTFMTTACTPPICPAPENDI